MTTTADPGVTMSLSTAIPETYAPSGRTSRFALTGLALVYLVLGIPTLVTLIVITVAIPLGVLGVGLAVLAAFVPFLRQLANVHRYFASQVLRTTVVSPYHERESSGVKILVKDWARDPARWRDLGWAYASSTIGWILSLIPVVLLLGVIWYLIFPFIYWVTPKGVFDMELGLVQIDDQASSFSMWILAGIVALMWWFLTPPVSRLRARMDLALLSPTRAELEKRLAEVSASRTETIDHSAAELRRIERDLHDGAQARLVSLGMSLGLAEQLMRTDPEAAARLIEEARATTTSALGDLRSVVRGIHPPVLADRGLVGAAQALALDIAVPTSFAAVVPGRAPEPVETAMYFAVAEALANVVKHAHASAASVDLSYDGERLRAVVADNGSGGADPADGTGLAGVARRLTAFDGTMVVESPRGGPTVVTMELPCALSSPKTSPSSGTA
ncbi:sensor domain-containing protein [Mumia sp. ZJ1417]|uniref:sensor histidine kinase n=1 Tax=Mumia sp. ZJ1417 TaxID=2708082 RepID=UPI00141F10D5|nr:sensor domain-containing protein [Mumia sp. ZJ1417]QMW66808.1 sensor domain-containing protein [Mumia sp. ZJ1417]